jgi:hypothetical protein
MLQWNLPLKKLKDWKLKQVLSEVVTSAGRGRHKERLKEGKYGGSTVCSGMKMGQWEGR